MHTDNFCLAIKGWCSTINCASKIIIILLSTQKQILSVELIITKSTQTNNNDKPL